MDGMAQVTISEARSNLKALIERVEGGEEVVITRRGKQVARLMPPVRQPKHFPDLSTFRDSLALNGRPLSETVIDVRRDSRY